MNHDQNCQTSSNFLQPSSPITDIPLDNAFEVQSSQAETREGVNGIAIANRIDDPINEAPGDSLQNKCTNLISQSFNSTMESRRTSIVISSNESPQAFPPSSIYEVDSYGSITLTQEEKQKRITFSNEFYGFTSLPPRNELCANGDETTCMGKLDLLKDLSDQTRSADIEISKKANLDKSKDGTADQTVLDCVRERPIDLLADASIETFAEHSTDAKPNISSELSTEIYLGKDKCSSDIKPILSPQPSNEAHSGKNDCSADAKSDLLSATSTETSGKIKSSLKRDLSAEIHSKNIAYSPATRCYMSSGLSTEVDFEKIESSSDTNPNITTDTFTKIRKETSVLVSDTKTQGLIESSTETHPGRIETLTEAKTNIAIEPSSPRLSERTASIRELEQATKPSNESNPNKARHLIWDKFAMPTEVLNQTISQNTESLKKTCVKLSEELLNETVTRKETRVLAEQSGVGRDTSVKKSYWEKETTGSSIEIRKTVENNSLTKLKSDSTQNKNLSLSGKNFAPRIRGSRQFQAPKTGAQEKTYCSTKTGCEDEKSYLERKSPTTARTERKLAANEDFWHDAVWKEIWEGRHAGTDRGDFHTVLCVDMSSSMKGDGAWEQADTFIQDYFKGLEELAKKRIRYEWVALVIFGSETKVVHGLCNSGYSSNRERYSLIKRDGPSPLYGGLALATACIACVPYRRVMVKGHAFPPKVILITDGKPSGTLVLSGPDEYIEEETVKAEKDILFLVKQMHNFRGLQIDCVPVGKNPNMTFLRSIINATSGNLLSHLDGTRISRRLVDLQEASLITGYDDLPAVNMVIDENPPQKDEAQEQPNTEDLRSLFEELAGKDGYAMMLASERKKDRIPSSFNTPEPSKKEGRFKVASLIPAGSRVRRGPDWNAGDEDGGRAGTVMNCNGEGTVGVSWDVNRSNYHKHYEYSSKKRTLKIVQEPRILEPAENLQIAPGCLVKRGWDWESGNEDGGEGNVGVVLRVYRQPAVVEVCWRSNGNQGFYCFGENNRFELQIIDPFNATLEELKYFGQILGGDPIEQSRVPSIPTATDSEQSGMSSPQKEKKNKNARNNFSLLNKGQGNRQ